MSPLSRYPVQQHRRAGFEDLVRLVHDSHADGDGVADPVRIRDRTSVRPR